MKYLSIGKDLKLPVNGVTERLAYLGRVGSGKTYAATKCAEEMIAAGAQIVVLDPVGKWYGLRLAADGKSPGLAIPVLGGLNGDIPLEPTSGAVIADLIVDKRVSVILDVSMFEADADKTRFATDWATRFYFRQKSSPAAVHIFVEEAEEFIPQNLQHGEERMLHAFRRIWKLGRNFGIGGSLISQRPQDVNKKALNMTECLFAFQMTGPQERKAIEVWIRDKGLDMDIAGDLPKLHQGTAHVWSPQWLRISETVQIGQKWTYDASSTPKVGQHVRVGDLAPIDLVELQEKMQSTIERAKENDPAALRREVARLRNELTAVARVARRSPAAVPAFKPPRTVTRIVTALKPGQITALQRSVSRLETLEIKRSTTADTTTKALQEFSVALSAVVKFSEAALKPPPAPVIPPLPPRPQPVVKTRRSQSWNSAEGAVKANGGVSLIKCERAILAALYAHGACTVNKLALLSGYRYTGSFRSSLSKLRMCRAIIGSNNDAIEITDEGRAYGPFENLPTGQELIDYWLNNPYFIRCEREILTALIENPEGLSVADLCGVTNYEFTGSFRSSLSKLRTAGVISGRNTEILKIAPELLST